MSDSVYLQGEKNKEKFIQKYPSVKEDINLFKIILTNLELYILKIFLLDQSPKTIRDIQLKTIRLIFDRAIFQHRKIEEVSNKLQEHLLAEGYGKGIIEKIKEKDLTSTLNLSTIDAEIKAKTTLLKKYNMKVPSYDLIQVIVQNFEMVGILKTRRRDKTSVYYLINPEFYKEFKNRFEKILEL